MEKIRILMVLNNPGRGGAQTYAMNVLRSIDRTKFQIDFVFSVDKENSYKDEILLLGSKIYFIPEFLVYGFGRIITFLKNILLKISFKSEIIDYYLSLDNNNNTYKAYFTEIEKRKKNLESLCKKGLKQYITFLVKIISDKNIKKVSFKSDIFNILQNLIKNEEYFTDQELFHIFDFANEIHNNPDYLIIIHEFMKIFENKIIKNNNNGQIVFNSLGNRLYNLCKTKENTNILRIVLSMCNHRYRKEKLSPLQRHKY